MSRKRSPGRSETSRFTQSGSLWTGRETSGAGSPGGLSQSWSCRSRLGRVLVGVQLGGSSGEVLVGGDLFDAGQATVLYAATVEDFIAARLWDHACLAAPLLRAQGGVLDEASLGYLQTRLTPAVATAGWPGARQYRFEGQDVRVLLWSSSQQCDWFISASSEPSLRAFAVGLLNLSSLRRALYATDDAGARVLDELRGTQR